MSKKQEHPLSHFHDRITDITSRFSFTHHPVPDQNGLIVAPQGFGRPFYHRESNTVGVLFSKTANNLEGRRLADGRIVATADQMERCYIFGARRARGDADTPLKDRANAHTMRRELREDLDTARRKLGVKSRKHFTLYGADNIYTNGRHVYEIVKSGDKQHAVVLHLSTRRKEGGFLPFDMNDKSLRGRFAYASKTIGRFDSEQAARRFVSEHWRGLAGQLWENQNIFLENGLSMAAKKLAADFVNVTLDKGGKIALTTGLVGSVFSVKYALAADLHAGTAAVLGAASAGLISTLIHTAVHIPVEFGVDEYSEARRRAKELKSKQSIDAFGYDVDVSDHFKIQTPSNLVKLCPHVDLDRFKAHEFEFLTLDQFDLRKDREQTQNNLQATSLAGYLMFGGQRGIPSEAFIADDATELRAFYSGVVRYMHEKDNGNIVVFAQYRPDMCRNDYMRVPPQYIDQFDGKIVRLEYDRMADTFGEGLVQDVTPVTMAQMMKEIEVESLFKDYKNLSWTTKQRSLEGITSLFEETGYSINPRGHKHMAVRSALKAADPA